MACEFSGVVRDAFIELGHDAWSCDLLPCDASSERHIQTDVLTVLDQQWDLMIAHPPCTYFSVSAAWAFSDGPYHQKIKPGTLVGSERRRARMESFEFVKALWSAPIKKVCMENPIGSLSSMFRKPDQIIQPWQFGHDASKATCLWLRGLPPLKPTDELPGGHSARRANQTASGQNRLSPSVDRWKLRSITYPGIGKAMAQQWSNQ